MIVFFGVTAFKTILYHAQSRWHLDQVIFGIRVIKLLIFEIIRQVMLITKCEIAVLVNFALDWSVEVLEGVFLLVNSIGRLFIAKFRLLLFQLKYIAMISVFIAIGGNARVLYRLLFSVNQLKFRLTHFWFDYLYVILTDEVPSNIE